MGTVGVQGVLWKSVFGTTQREMGPSGGEHENVFTAHGVFKKILFLFISPTIQRGWWT